ncbi:hypothetical protein [Maribacter sp. 4U21]|uniref:hypothetical protein n=1 Tax=Maribacter sp. 4U21 TaxID=1889779 RepID=UPI00117F1869|nr:hypothetical protein [Maribacter sp. 4U21]
MNKMVQAMRKVKNVKTLLYILPLFTMIACKAQRENFSIEKKSMDLGYSLLNAVYGKNESIGFLFSYTKGKDEYPYDTILIDGLSNFINYATDLKLFKCNIDSLFTMQEQKEIDLSFLSSQSQILDSSKFDNEAILGLDKVTIKTDENVRIIQGAHTFITFPLIYRKKNIVYGIFCEENLDGGLLYIFKKEDDYWIKICETTLYFT